MSYDDVSTYTAHQDGLPSMVLAFFRQNPEEMLESADIARKFAVPGSGSITGKMAPLVRMQLLKTERVGRVLHYSAGPMLDTWSGATKLRTGRARLKSASRCMYTMQARTGSGSK